MNVKEVPVDLLPILPRDYSDAWAEKTLQYKEAFCPLQVGHNPIEEEIKSWIRIGRDLAEDLKRRGLSRAKKRIVDMMNEFFGKTFNNRQFANLYDVSQWLSLRINYHANYEETLNMLHMFQYGIFRSGNNNWALDEAHSWMKMRNLAYKSKTEPNTRQGKGFVYKLLVSRASNTLCSRFQALTLRYHEEYVIVRNRAKHQTIPGQIVNQHIFNHLYKGAIIRRQEKTMKDKCFNNEEFLELNKLLCEANKKGFTFDELRSLLQNVDKDSRSGNFLLNVFLFNITLQFCNHEY